HLGLLGELDEQTERVPVEKLAAEIQHETFALEREVIEPVRLGVEKRADRRLLEDARVMLKAAPGPGARAVGLVSYRPSIRRSLRQSFTL
ncbi:MAG: hypothetical protein C0P79_013030, partial [Gammaproteobacteria bacterium]